MRAAVDLSLQDLLKKLNGLISKLERYGLRVPNNSRLLKFKYELSRCVASVEQAGDFPNNADFAVLTQGIRDYLEFRTVASVSIVAKANLPALQKAMGGNSLPFLDADTRSRDLQFQLYMEAVLSRSGFTVQSSEPDIIFQFESENFCVAAKRINRIGSLRKRFRNAKRQIKSSSLRGFIAFSADRIIHAQTNADAYVYATRPDDLYDAAEQTLRQVLKSKISPVATSVSAPYIIGHIASLTIPAIIPRQKSIGFGQSIVFISAEEATTEMGRRISRIADRIRLG